MTYIHHVPVETWALQEQEEQLEAALQQIERARVSICKAITQYRSWDELSKNSPDFQFKSFHLSIEVMKEKVKITIPEILPYVKMQHRIQDKDYYRMLNAFYVSEMTNAIEKAKIPFQIEKSFVLIKQFFPDLMVRDFDNQFKSFVFNALRYSKLIPDDSWGHLTYMEMGELDRENPRTEIIVMNESEINQLMGFSVKNIC